MKPTRSQSPSAVRFDHGSPSIAIVNESSDVNVAELRRAVAAFQKQIDRDFYPKWGWRAQLSFEEDIPDDAMRVVLKETSEDPEDGDLFGYHFIDGVPRTEVFTRDTKGKPYKEYYSVISHELLEMIADPGANLFADGYLGGDPNKPALISFEVCDPVQDRSYTISGIKVSDFVTPEWFEPERKARSLPFTHLGSVHRPFGMTSGGYVDAYYKGVFKTVWGEQANKRKHRRRLHVRKHSARVLGQRAER